MCLFLFFLLHTVPNLPWQPAWWIQTSTEQLVPSTWDPGLTCCPYLNQFEALMSSSPDGCLLGHLSVPGGGSRWWKGAEEIVSYGSFHIVSYFQSYLWEGHFWIFGVLHTVIDMLAWSSLRETCWYHMLSSTQISTFYWSRFFGKFLTKCFIIIWSPQVGLCNLATHICLSVDSLAAFPLQICVKLLWYFLNIDKKKKKTITKWQRFH